jgi:lysophospholipase L1-like esterase
MGSRYSTVRLAVLFAIVLTLVMTWTLWPASVATATVYQVNYTALGDSIAFGLYAFPGLGYVPLYAKALHNFSHLNVNLFPLGVPGWTSTDLANALKTNLVFQLSVYGSDAITFNIGGNDLNHARSLFKAGTCGGSDNQKCLVDAVSTFQSNWATIISVITLLRKGRPTILRTMDIYNPFVSEDSAAGDYVVLNTYLTQVNDIIHLTESAPPPGIPKIPYARVYDAFNIDPVTKAVVDPASKGLLSFDGFHPNTAGHAAIAARLNALGYGATVP